MSSNFITKISPSIKLLVLLLLILIILLAKSIYMLLFMTILTLILLIITDKKVNLYVKSLKKASLILLIFLAAYIIILENYNFISIALFGYKLIIITTLLRILFFYIDFGSMQEGVYGILLPLKKINLNVERVSFDITLAIWFMKFLNESNDRVRDAQTIINKKSKNIKHFMLPCLVYAINELTILQSNLKIKFYKINYRKVDFRSKILLGMFVLLFIICLFKEVIL